MRLHGREWATAKSGGIGPVAVRSSVGSQDSLPALQSAPDALLWPSVLTGLDEAIVLAVFAVLGILSNVSCFI